MGGSSAYTASVNLTAKTFLDTVVVIQVNLAVTLVELNLLFLARIDYVRIVAICLFRGFLLAIYRHMVPTNSMQAIMTSPARWRVFSLDLGSYPKQNAALDSYYLIIIDALEIKGDDIQLIYS